MGLHAPLSIEFDALLLLFSGFKCQNYSMSVLFFAYDILRMVFVGSSFKGVPLLGGSLLNSTTVLLDKT